MTPYTKMVGTLLLPALLLVASPQAHSRQEPSANEGQAGPASMQALSPEARQVLDRMTAQLRQLQTFSVRTRATRDEVVALGFKLQNNETSHVIVQRPNRLRAEVTGDVRNRTIVYDGSQLWMHSPDDAAYVRVPAPDNIAALMDGLLDLGVDMPVVDFLYVAADGSLIDGVRAGILVGTTTIEGVECYQLAFRQANIDWQLWVETGARALPRKIAITTRYEFGEPQFQSILDWDLSPRIQASTFKFAPPKGSVEIPLAAIVSPDSDAPGQEQGP
jgi:hypothetical protein